MKTFISALSFDQLVAVLAIQGLPTSGTFEELQVRLQKYVDAHPEIFATTPMPLEVISDTASTYHTAPTSGNHTEVINQIRKWGIHFDGRDPIAFLERIEELSAGYNYTGE